MIAIGVVEDLRTAREAYERREWVAAYRALSDVRDPALTSDDFAALATTAYLLGRRNDCIQALQRAYQSSLAGGDRPAAVRAAYWMTVVLRQGGELAVAHGWQDRAARLLAEHQADVVEHGYLQDATMMGHILAGEVAEAIRLAPQITDCGRRFDEPDLLALGLHAEGRLLVMSGKVAEGLRVMDEALTGVMAGQVSPITAGRVYCSTIEACQDVCDYDRAGQWTRALTTWCDEQPGLVAFTGQCATHRGQLLRLHGAYAEAVEELGRAVDRYRAAGGDPALALSHYELGETYRLLGDYPAAEAAYEQAAAHGHPGQPGRALLLLSRGRHDAAEAAIRRLLAEREDPVSRSQVLAAAVEVLVACGDVVYAAALADELCAVGREFGCSALEAAGHQAVATVELARESAEEALRAARAASEAWSQLREPYEAARSRTLMGRALRLLGDDDSASAEVAAARQALAEIGALPAESAAASLWAGTTGTGTPGGLSPRESEVLRLVAVGRSNREIAEELVISERTVDRHVSNIFIKLDVRSRTAAAAYAYEHRLL